jgi:hypothetical protein
MSYDTFSGVCVVDPQPPIKIETAVATAAAAHLVVLVRLDIEWPPSLSDR